VATPSTGEGVTPLAGGAEAVVRRGARLARPSARSPQKPGDRPSAAAGRPLSSQIDEPQDDVAVALAGLAHGAEFAEPDHALALRVGLRLICYAAERERGGLAPRRASTVMAMRVMPEADRRRRSWGGLGASSERPTSSATQPKGSRSRPSQLRRLPIC
jgi:hypothetical protein